MLHSFGPRHLTDVHQPLYALLELHKGSIVGDADYPSAYVGTYRIAMRRVQPWVRSELFESQRNPLFVFIEFEYLDLDLIAHIHQVPWMCQSTPGHVGNMQQAIDSAQVHERAIFGQILDYAGQHRTFFEVF